AQTLQAAAPGSALAAHARTRSHRTLEARSVFPPRVGNRPGSPPPRHSRDCARLRRQFHGHLLPRHFPRLPTALGALFRALPERTARRLPRHRHRYLRRRSFRKRSEEHTSELQSHLNLVCRLLLEKKKTKKTMILFLVLLSIV